MIRAFFIFFVLFLSIYLGIQLKDDPGYVLIAVHHWTIESTLWVAIISLCFLFIILHGLLLMTHWLLNLPSTWQYWRTKQRSQHAQAKTRKGLIEFSEGHWLQAKNDLIKALPDSDAPLLNYLTAARAAQEMGDSKLRDDYLREAQQAMPEARIAVELTQAQLQLANQQWEQALATLRHLQDLAPQHAYVLKLLVHLYEEVKDWPQLIALLPALKRNQVVSNEIYDSLEKNAYLQAMLDLIKQDQETPLTTFMDKLPRHLNQDAELIAPYCRYLLSKHQDAKIESRLRRSLYKRYDEKLIEIYGEINCNEGQLKFAESLLKSQPHAANLLLCLGRLCIQKNLWGKAKTYLEQSLACKEQASTYMALGKLLEQLNETNAAVEAYRRGLEITVEFGQKTR